MKRTILATIWLLERFEISKIEKDGYNLRFYMDKCDLPTWSVVFEKHPARLMGSGGKAPILYKLNSKDEPLKALRRVLCDYMEAVDDKNNN